MLHSVARWGLPMFVVPLPRAAPWAIESRPVGAKPRNKTHRFSDYTRFLQYQLGITPVSLHQFGHYEQQSAVGITSTTSRDRRLVRLIEPDFGGFGEVAEDDVGIPVAIEIADGQRLRVAGGECRAFLEAAFPIVQPHESWS